MRTVESLQLLCLFLTKWGVIDQDCMLVCYNRTWSHIMIHIILKIHLLFKMFIYKSAYNFRGRTILLFRRINRWIFNCSFTIIISFIILWFCFLSSYNKRKYICINFLIIICFNFPSPIILKRLILIVMMTMM